MSALHPNDTPEPPGQALPAPSAGLWADLQYAGLDVPLLRLGTHLLALMVFLVTAWGMGKLPLTIPVQEARRQAVLWSCLESRCLVVRQWLYAKQDGWSVVCR